MTDYNNDDPEEDYVDNDQPLEENNGAAAGNGRNFLLALGILGAVFVLLVIALIIVFLSRPRGGEVTNINATNAVIMTANAGTASAATQAALFLRTPSVTPTATITFTASPTSVLAVASATPTLDQTQAVAATATGSVIERNTATVGALLLTQNAPTQVAQTQAALGKITNTPGAGTGVTPGIPTATALPTTGFADDIGLPGLFGMALGLVLLIVLARRLRFSPGR